MIGIIGISQKSVASLTERESLSEEFIRIVETHLLCIRAPSILIQTCNRTEWYYSVEEKRRGHEIYELIISILQNFFKKQGKVFQNEMVYVHFGISCFIHLYQVVSGIDSPFFGETEIQGQVKKSYIQAAALSALNSELHFLFQKALHTGKVVRKKFPHSRIGEMQLDQIIVQKMKESSTVDLLPIFPLLLVGASAIHCKLLQALQTEFSSSSQIYIANRTKSKADLFAEKFGINSIPFEKALLSLGDFATVSFALTVESSSYFISGITIERGSIQPLLFDIGFPRNVDPKMYLHFRAIYTMETLIPSREKELNMNLIELEAKALARELALHHYNRVKTHNDQDIEEMG